MSCGVSVAVFLAMLSSDEYCTKQLDRLLALYREYGRPMPPPDAQLVRFVCYDHVVGVSEGEKRVDPGVPWLGFSLDGRTVLGHFNEPCEVVSIVGVKPDLTAIGNDVGLADLDFAIHCHARGWGPLAREAYRRWVRETEWPSAEVYLATSTCSHWSYRIYRDPGTPLALVAKHLKLAVSGLDAGRDDYFKLLRSLELSLKPRNSPPGSDAALIDELIELAGKVECRNYTQEPFRADPRYRAIVHRGLAIVPALIAHLEDDRITRVFLPVGFQHYRVKDIVLDILEELHGGPFLVPEDTPAERLRVIGKWIADAEKLGEEQYLMTRILGEDEKDEEPRLTLFWLLTEKYPERVPAVYRALIDKRPGHRDFSLRYAKAIADGPLPAAEKRKILEYAAIQESPAHRWAGIYYLRPYDPKLAKGLLLAALANMPNDPSESEARLALIVAEGTDPEEWQMLSKTVRRLDPGTRLELLRMISLAKTVEGRTLRLAFLAEYLTDDAVRDVNSDFNRFRYSWVVGRDFPQLEVRNFSAMRLAVLLGLDVEPEKEWSAAQWAELREKVRAAVAKEPQR